MFSIHTFGPFRVETNGRRFLADSFWKTLDEENPSLPEMFGVYIFARKQTEDRLLPVYVGKTTSTFAKRLKGHFRSSTVLSKVGDLSSDESLYLFLIGVTTEKKTIAAKRTKSRRTWVDFLETAFITQCQALNKDLQNDKKTLLNRKVCVPGFLGDDPSKRGDAAKALARMLDAQTSK